MANFFDDILQATPGPSADSAPAPPAAAPVTASPAATPAGGTNFFSDILAATPDAPHQDQNSYKPDPADGPALTVTTKDGFVDGKPLGPLESDPSDPNNAGAPGLKDAPSLKDALDFNEKLANGVTMGYAPRIGAAFDYATGRAPSYDAALADRNATDQRISNEMPIGSKVGEVIGSALGMAIPGGAAANAARDASLVGRVGAGAATGAAMGGVQGASQSDDLTNLPQTAVDAAHGAELGASVGAGLPAVGALAGNAYRAAAPFFGSAAAPGMSRIASGIMANVVNPSTTDRLAALGPQGMIADTSPSALGVVQGIAAKGGVGSDIAVGNLTNRASGQSNRLLGSLDDNLGPAISPRQAGQMMQDRQDAAGPLYAQAMRNAPSVIDITPARQQLENARIYAKGTDAARLDRFAQLLQGPQRVGGVAQPEYDPQALQRAKFEMDAQIEGVNNQTGSAAATATRDMVGVRNALNTAMEQQIPGYADANLAYATAMRGREAFDSGRQALKPGADTMWPEDLNRQFAPLPIEQQALMRTGARSDIAAGLGTNRNDLSALNKVVGGENDFNRPKMETLFGPEQTQNVIRDVNNERTFADTYNKVAQGSQSAQRLAGSSALDGAEGPRYLIPKTGSAIGLAGHAGEFMVRKAFDTIARNTGNTTRQQLAEALTAPTPQAAGNLQDLAAALMGHRANSEAIRSSLSNPATLAGALAAYRSATR